MLLLPRLNYENEHSSKTPRSLSLSLSLEKFFSPSQRSIICICICICFFFFIQKSLSHSFILYISFYVPSTRAFSILSFSLISFFNFLRIQKIKKKKKLSLKKKFSPKTKTPLILTNKETQNSSLFRETKSREEIMLNIQTFPFNNVPLSPDQT